MKNLLKRVLTGLLGAAMLVPALSLSSCGNSNAPVKEKATNVYKSEVLMSYTEDWTTGVDSSNPQPQALYPCGDGVVLYSTATTADWETVSYYSRINTETGEQTEILMPAMPGEDYYDRGGLTFGDDDTVWYVATGYQWDDETGNGTSMSVLVHASFDGSSYAECDLYQKLGLDSSTDYISISGNPVIYNGDFYFGCNNAIYRVSSDLSDFKKIDLPNGAQGLNSYFLNNGSMIVAYYSGSDYSQQVASLDLSTLSYGESVTITGNASNYLYSAMPSDTYTFVYSTSDSVFGYDLATDTSTELLNWVNSDIMASYVQSVLTASDGTVYALINDYQTNKYVTNFLKLTRIPDDQVPEKYLLTLGGLYITNSLRRAVINFNKASDEYRITIRDYSVYATEENNYEGGTTRFNNDIVTGDIPDILILSSDGLDASGYSSKGLFADLKPYLEKDTEIDMSDMYENILDALSVDGKLYQIFSNFSVNVPVGKTSIFGKDGVTADELLAVMAKYPDASLFSSDVTRSTFLNYLVACCRDEFINKDTGECSFDNGEFAKLLEICKALPETSSASDNGVIIDDPGFWTEYAMTYRNGESLLDLVSFYSYTNFWEEQEGTFGEAISYVGFPNADTSKYATAQYDIAYAISSKSQLKDGAWAFVRTMLLAEKNDSDYDPANANMFSIFRSVNKKMEDYALSYNTTEWVYDETTDTYEEVPNGWQYWLGDSQIDIGSMTQEAADRVNELLDNVSYIYEGGDDELMTIITEESSSYFAGQKTASEVASLIQSRVSIYVNESR